MKFFHLSDLHLGLKLHGRDLAEDQAYVLNQIVKAAGERRPDAVLMAGDIYDRSMPSGEAMRLFDAFLTDLRKATPNTEILVISGNHDNALRINTYRELLAADGIHLIGLPPEKPEDRIARVTLTDEYGEVDFLLLPFVRPSMLRGTLEVPEGESLPYEESIAELLEREELDPERRTVLVSHQFYVPTGKDAEDVERAETETRMVGNVDAVSTSLLDAFDYAALGHIHKPTAMGRETVQYSGTPMPCSFSEEGQQKAILEVTMKEKGDVHIESLPLLPLHEIRTVKGTLEEVLQDGSSEDYISVQLTERAPEGSYDLRDKLQAVFPNLLEIKFDTPRSSSFRERAGGTSEQELSPYDICMEFLGDCSEQEEALLREVLNDITEKGNLEGSEEERA